MIAGDAGSRRPAAEPPARLRPVIVATRNPGKLAELRPMLAAAGYRPVDLDSAGLVELAEEAAVECHATFEENALAKARYFARRAGGLPVLADDSGLVVDALGGAPGVHSRRWAALEESPPPGAPRGETAANNARLMREMRDVEDRSARFICAAAWVVSSGSEGAGGAGRAGRAGGADGAGGERALVRRGEVPGVILREPRGEDGFGYDPYFFSTELGMGFGEAGRELKATVSHRARALQALLDAVARL